MLNLFSKKKDETPLAAFPSRSDELHVDDEAIQVMPQAYGILSTSLKPHEAPSVVVPAPQQPVVQLSTNIHVDPIVPPKAGLRDDKSKSGKNFDRRILWVLGGVVLVLVIVVTALLLWPRETPAPTPVVPTSPIVVTPPTPPSPLLESVPPPPPPDTPPVWIFPAPISSSPLGVGDDQDKDNLTDIEEALFKTNQALVDSDGDSYSDGLEVVNVYSPRRGRRARIFATAEVSTFTWSPGKAKFIYPAGLRVETKDELVVITTATGESFSLRLFSLEPFTSLSEWIKIKAPLATGVWTQENYRGQESWWSPDNATALLAYGGQIYFWHYEVSGKPAANFFSTFKLLVRSIQFK